VSETLDEQRPGLAPLWPAEEERYAYIRGVVARAAPPPADIVELGAAPGAQSVALARAGYRVAAIDLGEASDAWAGQAEGVMTHAFAESGVAFVEWNLEETPYPLEDGSFDIVLLTEVLEHLREYPLQALLEARRILRPGGHLVVTTPNAARLQNRVRLALGGSVHTPLSDWMFGLPHARHAREYTAAELREMLAHAGLRVVSLEARHFHIRSGRQDRGSVALKRLLDLAARARPSLGSGLVVVARRDVTHGGA
jgi:2-polyprenyl-3-methyl-5-hydroxy-6-metoxy-1,4-benzoquinol methylase